MDNKGLTVLKTYADGSRSEEILLDDWVGGFDGLKVAGLRDIKVDDNCIYVLSRANEPRSGDTPDLWVYPIAGGKPIMRVETETYAIDYKGYVYTYETISDGTPDYIRDHTGINRYNALTGELVEAYHTRTFIPTIGYNSHDDSIYWKGPTYFCRAPAESISEYEVETLVDECMPRIGGHAIMFNGMAFYSDGTILIANFGKIFKYTPAGEWQYDVDYDLVVTAPYREDYMQSVITLYENADPGKYVKYEYTYNSYEAMMGGYQSDNYFDNETLDLLSGNVGDIFVITEVNPNVINLLSSTALTDLGPFLESDPPEDPLSQPMIDAVSIDGRTRALPLTMDLYYSRPINLKAQEERIEDAFRMQGKANAKKYKSEMNNIYESLDYLYDIDVPRMAIITRVISYMHGEVSLDEALDGTEEEIWLWLNE